MKEVRKYVLNSSEIRDIIANRFRVDSSDVVICVDDGDPQYPTTNVYAEVTQKAMGNQNNCITCAWSFAENGVLKCANKDNKIVEPDQKCGYYY